MLGVFSADTNVENIGKLSLITDAVSHTSIAFPPNLIPRVIVSTIGNQIKSISIIAYFAIHQILAVAPKSNADKAGNMPTVFQIDSAMIIAPQLSYERLA